MVYHALKDIIFFYSSHQLFSMDPREGEKNKEVHYRISFPFINGTKNLDLCNPSNLALGKSDEV